MKIICALALIVYIGALAFLYFGQRRILYIPPQAYFNPSAAGVPSALEVYAGDNSHQMIGWWIAPQTPDAPVVMYFHGNGSAVYGARDIYAAFQARGWGVMAVVYPGYPGAKGAPTQESLTEAALRARAYLSGANIASDRIVYYGTSLGAGVAAQLCVDYPPALLIMEAPFSSAQDRAQNMLPLFPAALLVKDAFRSDEALRNLSMPLLWLHGTDDRVIPIAEGRALYEGYSGPKLFHVVQGGGHNDLWYRGGQAVIHDAIERVAVTPQSQ